ncbi:MAG: ankyrin repeat domain-containing protein [Verrucomicrobiota bacterium]
MPAADTNAAPCRAMIISLQEWLARASYRDVLQNGQPVLLESVSVSGDTLMHIAAIDNDVVGLELLLDAGLEVNARGEDGYTPLHEAVEQSNYDAVALLLQKGADVHLETITGFTALDLARAKNDIRMLEILSNRPGNAGSAL